MAQLKSKKGEDPMARIPDSASTEVAAMAVALEILEAHQAEHRSASDPEKATEIFLAAYEKIYGKVKGPVKKARTISRT